MDNNRKDEYELNEQYTNYFKNEKIQIEDYEKIQIEKYENNKQKVDEIDDEDIQVLMAKLNEKIQKNLVNKDMLNFNYELNERQVRILKEEGLPTDYYELDGKQQICIIEIEKMLEFIENKYHKEFVYDSFYYEEPWQNHQLIAFPKGCEELKFSVEKNPNEKEMLYTDNYLNAISIRMYGKHLYDLIHPMLKEHEIKIVPRITDISDSFVKEPMNVYDLEGQMVSFNELFIDGTTCGLEDIIDFEKELEDVIRKHKMYGSYKIVLLKEKMINDINEMNYMDFLSSEKCIMRETMVILEGKQTSISCCCV